MVFVVMLYWFEGVILKVKEKNYLLNRFWVKCCVVYESNILV